jgi:hypothetical protein
MSIFSWKYNCSALICQKISYQDSQYCLLSIGVSYESFQADISFHDFISGIISIYKSIDFKVVNREFTISTWPARRRAFKTKTFVMQDKNCE